MKLFKWTLDVGNSNESGGGKKPQPQPETIPPRFDLNDLSLI